MGNEQEAPFYPARKRVTGIVTASGLLFALIGFVFVLYMVAQKREELRSIEQKIVDAKDSLADLSEKLDSAKSTMLKLNFLIQAQGDTTITKTADSLLIANQSAMNAIDGKQASAKFNKPLIYIQVNDSQSLTLVQRVDLISSLNAKGYKAFGYELTMGRADNTLRYFHSEDETTAHEIIVEVKNLTGITVTPRFAKGYEKTVPVGQCELWIRKDD